MSKKKPTQRPDPAGLGMPAGGVDSHAHIDLEQFEGEVPDVVARARAAGVERIGNVFLGPEAYRSNSPLFQDLPEVFFLLGVHPNNANQCTPEAMDAMREAFRTDSRIRALGEIGLDFYWDDMPADLQERVFRLQLGLARELDVPVAIHSRDADARSLQVLDEEGWAGRPLLWHCFGGGPEFAEEILKRGWMISIPGPVTYPKNQTLRDAVRAIPPDRLVLETDCPFLTPQAWRGKRNEPAYLVFTNQAAAEAKDMDPAELWLTTAANAKRFYGL